MFSKFMLRTSCKQSGDLLEAPLTETRPTIKHLYGLYGVTALPGPAEGSEVRLERVRLTCSL